MISKNLIVKGDLIQPIDDYNGNRLVKKKSNMQFDKNKLSPRGKDNIFSEQGLQFNSASSFESKNAQNNSSSGNNPFDKKLDQFNDLAKHDDMTPKSAQVIID